MNPQEEWRSVVGYEGAYEVSSYGRVRSLDRVTEAGRKWRGQMMTASSMRNGYLVVTLWKDRRQRTRLVHRLVLAAFFGEPIQGHEALHGDGDRTNNHLTNLSWGSHSENQYDQVAHGTHVHASKTSCPAGHPYDDENTYVYPGRAHRGCRTCRRAHMQNFHNRKAMAA